VARDEPEWRLFLPVRNGTGHPTLVGQICVDLVRDEPILPAILNPLDGNRIGLGVGVQNTGILFHEGGDRLHVRYGAEDDASLEYGQIAHDGVSHLFPALAQWFDVRGADLSRRPVSLVAHRASPIVAASGPSRFVRADASPNSSQQ